MHERGIEIAWVDGALHISGEADTDTSPYMLNAIDQHFAGQDRVRLVNDKLMFCDSSCLATFLAVVNNGKHLILVRPSPQVRRALDLLGILEALDNIEVED